MKNGYKINLTECVPAKNGYLIRGKTLFFICFDEKMVTNILQRKITHENINQFQNPFRRPIASAVFLLGTVVAIWLGIGATLPIDISLTLGLF